MMRKSKLQHEDPYLGLLSIRNIVNEGWHTSPAQRMFGRATKTLLPTTASHLTQSSVSNSKDRDKANKRRSDEALRFNQHARELKPLKVVHQSEFSLQLFSTILGSLVPLQNSYHPDLMKLKQMKDM